MKETMITEAGAAKYLGISLPALRYIRYNNEFYEYFPTFYRIGGKIKYKMKDLDSYIENCKVSPPKMKGDV